MTLPGDRRRFLTSVGAGALLSLAPPLVRTAMAAPEALELGSPQAFHYNDLVERARKLASGKYAPPPVPTPEITKQIDYATHGKISYDPQNALFAKGPGVYPATFFHLGMYFPKTVRMFAIVDGKAREVRYTPDLFEMPKDSIARQLPETAGFAGFRLHEKKSRDDWKTQDWIAFLGASYFRAIGALGQYGMSARGITVDTATSNDEEFPDFTEFYIQPAREPDQPVEVAALLQGPSITGAYRFKLWRTDGVITEIEKRLFLRKDVERLGIAPLTSMFWFAEYGEEKINDWRPEVHDSDGLAMWNGRGERLWRPLNNPEATTTSSFLDNNPKGFGLLQRDRMFDHYLDGVHYERRPSVWVEPLGEWGEGSVQLVEIPTDDEIHDNIGAFWVPKAPARAGQELRFHYKLHWLADEPYPAEDVGRCVSTRMGRGGKPGEPRPEGVKKFMVTFADGPIAELADDAEVKVKIEASRGEVSYVFTERVPGTRRWRAQFDLAATGPEPVEIRAFLHQGGKPLTETWLYQHHPGRTGEG